MGSKSSRMNGLKKNPEGGKGNDFRKSEIDFTVGAYFLLMGGIFLAVYVFYPLQDFEKARMIENERNAVKDIIGIELQANVSFTDNLSGVYQDYGGTDSIKIGGFYSPIEKAIYIGNSFRPSATVSLPHELCHAFTRELNCKEIIDRPEEVYGEGICNAYAYYRHPFIYRLSFIPLINIPPASLEKEKADKTYLKITSQLNSRNCLDAFFRNYSKNCAKGSVLRNLRALCGVKLT